MEKEEKIAKLMSVVLKDMKNGTYDLTKNGKCSECGECCSNLLPMTEEEVRIIKKYVRKHGLKAHNNRPRFLMVDIDSTCPFLDVYKTEHKCDIYEVRPLICSDFKCDHASKGIMPDIRLYQEHREPYDLRQTFFGE